MRTVYTRRGLLGSCLAATTLPFFNGAAWAAPVAATTLPGAPFVEVETANGKVRGGTARGALSFKGVPYGGSLSGTPLKLSLIHI